MSAIPKILSVTRFVVCLLLVGATSAWSQDEPNRRPTRCDRTSQDAPSGVRDRDRPSDGQPEGGVLEGVPPAPEVVPGRPPWRVRPPQRPWQLGVYAVNTSTGVRVTRVIPGTPAAREGLEPGDVILTVDGYQIGFVNGRLYPLGEELARRAGPRGHVTLLVQNVRNRTLLNMEVSFLRDREGPWMPGPREAQPGSAPKAEEPSRPRGEPRDEPAELGSPY